MLTLLKEIISVENIKKNSSAVFIALALLIAGYFINEWTASNNNCDVRVDRIQAQKDSIAGKYFDALQKIYQRDEIIKEQQESIVRTDSIIRTETKKDATQIIKQSK